LPVPAHVLNSHFKKTLFFGSVSPLWYFSSNIQCLLQMVHQTYSTFCRWFIKHTVFIIKHTEFSSDIRYFLQMVHQTYGHMQRACTILSNPTLQIQGVPYLTVLNPHPIFQKYFVEFRTSPHSKNRYVLPLPLSSAGLLALCSTNKLQLKENTTKGKKKIIYICIYIMLFACWLA